MATIPLFLNVYPSGNNIQVAQSGSNLYIGAINLGSLDTGSLINAFYPRVTNPKGYITQSWIGGLASSGDILSTSGHLQKQIDKINTSSGILSGTISGNVIIQGGATINNGELLIGNASDNSFQQGRLSAGNGINITSGAGSLTISATANPSNLPPPYFYAITARGSNTTLGSGHFMVVHTGNNAVIFTLPSPVGISGRMWVIKNASPALTTITSPGQIYLTGNVSSFSFTSGDTWSIHSDGIKYYVH